MREKGGGSMNIIVCLEDKNGMMFNKRRLSQDVAIREDIYKNMDGKSLIMNDYSYKMFSKDEPKIDIIVREDLPVCDKENLQFIEDKQLGNFESEIDKMIVYYWNRRYPSDLKFDIDFSNGRYMSEHTHCTFSLSLRLIKYSVRVF